jgi:hypothetical protein
MSWKAEFAFGLAALMGGGAYAQAQSPPPLLPPITKQVNSNTTYYAPGAAPILSGQPVQIVQAQEPVPSEGQATSGAPYDPTQGSEVDAGGLGPTPLGKVGILQHLIYGDDADKAKIKFSGWLDFDYTFRSTSPGINNIAPVMNRFGDEALARQLGIYITKPLDPKDWSWGFNSIFIGGSDASFLGPTAGGWANTNPRFGAQFTDLNLTAHLPILTEGGVDVKAGRQTTVLGPMGALPWQRYFDSSDYAWYNLEEGRYTGVSTNWHITKQLSWYNGVEIGGWGVFFDNPSRGVDYITQINYWLDPEAKKTLLTFTVLTGPTGFTSNGNTTATEFTVTENWTKYLYQVASFQMNYSKAPIFFTPPPGYQERAYDVYSYMGYHLTPLVDVNTRIEWYKDVDGGGYPGGFGIPHTEYYASTVGFDYHPTKCLQFRPEVRYDYASNPAFGELKDKKKQLSIAAEVLIKF